MHTKQSVLSLYAMLAGLKNLSIVFDLKMCYLMIKIGNCCSAKPKPTVAHESVIAKSLNRSRVAHILFSHHYTPFMAKLSLHFYLTCQHCSL